jgi:hypothetical protein
MPDDESRNSILSAEGRASLTKTLNSVFLSMEPVQICPDTSLTPSRFALFDYN